ncbi:MAG: hypothetical protein JNL70_24895 [Saprospiraceae bacterium]|nr:hypothetical protein [Saprospiraceae bacterium]
MGVFKEEILSSWRWVLIFGTAIGLLSIVNVYLFAGVNPSLALILMSVAMILSIVFACCAVYFHRNKNLNGHISMTVGFTVALSTFVWGIIVGFFIQNYLF